MTAPNCQRPQWTRAETDALEMLYLAGWSWRAIAAHVSGVRGVTRSYRACSARGNAIGLAGLVNRRRRRLDHLLEEVEELMILDRSLSEMQAELGVSQAWLSDTINRHISPQRRESWRNSERERRVRAGKAWRAAQRRTAA